jgi:hypothetical protein
LGGTGRFTLDKFVGVKKNGRNRVKTRKADSCRGRQYIIIIIIQIKKNKKMDDNRKKELWRGKSRIVRIK